MSVFTWGKMKFTSNPQKMINFEKEGIWIMFDLPDFENCKLHVTKLEKNEIYFDVLCDYSYYHAQKDDINPIDYANNDIFLSLQYTGKYQEKYTPILSVELYERLKKLQRVLKKLIDFPEVEEVYLFNTEMGALCLSEDYKQVNWQLENFAYEFFKAMNNNNMFTPTIWVNFSKRSKSEKT